MSYEIVLIFVIFYQLILFFHSWIFKKTIEVEQLILRTVFWFIIIILITLLWGLLKIDKVSYNLVVLFAVTTGIIMFICIKIMTRYFLSFLKKVNFDIENFFITTIVLDVVQIFFAYLLSYIYLKAGLLSLSILFIFTGFIFIFFKILLSYRNSNQMILFLHSIIKPNSLYKQRYYLNPSHFKNPFSYIMEYYNNLCFVLLKTEKISDLKNIDYNFYLYQKDVYVNVFPINSHNLSEILKIKEQLPDSYLIFTIIDKKFWNLIDYNYIYKSLSKKIKYLSKESDIIQISQSYFNPYITGEL